MNLSKATEYADSMLETEHSDGCTWSPDFWVGICCKRHDMLRRFKQISAPQADWYFFLMMIRRGFPLAPLYYAAVVVARRFGAYR